MNKEKPTSAVASLLDIHLDVPALAMVCQLILSFRILENIRTLRKNMSQTYPINLVLNGS
jgi:hypothetical protein